MKKCLIKQLEYNKHKFKLLCEFIQNNALKEHGEPIYEAKVPQPLL